MAQSLIEQLQLGAVDGSAPITDLLRKAKLAAVKLQAADFISWIDKEMGGYRHNDELPGYRVVHGQLKFLNPFHGWRPIVGLNALEQGIHQPAGELFQLTQTESGYVTITIPEQFRQMVCAEIGMEFDVRLHIGLTALSGVLEAIRNNILEWTLKLEQAGIRGEGLSFTPEETRAAHSLFVTNNYHGPVASIAQGSNTIGSISQTNSSATPQEIAEAVARLLVALQGNGAPSPRETAAASVLAEAQPELKAGRMPFGKVSKALDLLGKGEDIAIRAPEVANHLHQLAQMLGIV